MKHGRIITRQSKPVFTGQWRDDSTGHPSYESIALTGIHHETGEVQNLVWITFKDVMNHQILCARGSDVLEDLDDHVLIRNRR